MAATCAVRHLRRTIPIPTYPGHLARLLHSVPAVVQSSSYVDKRPAAERLGEDVLDLDDGRSLFGSFSTSRLVRSAASLHAAAVGPVVDVGTWVMGSKVIMGPGLLRDAVLWGVRRTFYDQFCAGEDMPEVVRSVRRVNALGLRAMLDYALEDVEDGASCDRNLEEFLTTIDATRTLPPSSVSLYSFCMMVDENARFGGEAVIVEVNSIWFCFVAGELRGCEDIGDLFARIA
ncbi:hypothetical protein MLD38_013141 [Melastoma candidum]|uniref:Uncharacterized protein n=1 Tax=Melastoma candidum TaxID=119954 RepID=A0ACB9R8P2_9MYRT|nr:hypothetical protein MLD38_013141 [Melastoma candidum]